MSEDLQQKQIERLSEDLTDLQAYIENFSSFLPIAVCVLNPAQIIININRVFTELFETDEQSALGKRFDEFLSQGDNEKLSAFLQDLEEKSERVVDESADSRVPTSTMELSLESGMVISIKASVQRDADDEFIGYFVAVSDITELKSLQGDLAEKVWERTAELEKAKQKISSTLVEVQREQAKTASIVKNLTDGLLLLDPDGLVQIINPTAQKLLAVNKHDIHDKHLPHDDSRLGVLAEVLTSSETLEREELDLSHNITVEVTTVVINDSKRDGYRLVILHDVTREKQVERMKVQFVSVVAHQLRTPLAAVRWSFDLLTEKFRDNEEVEEIIARGSMSTQRILKIIRGILSMDRIESGRFLYKFSEVNIGELVQEYVNQTRDSREYMMGTELVAHNLDNLPLVRADEEKIEIVLQNYIENALKYTPADGTVEVSGEVQDDKVVIAVKDDGIGIPEEDQDSIFSKFFRADNAVHEQTDGNGIGLYIVKEVVEGHDGRVWFESEEGKGTTFFFSLPIAGPDTDTAPED